MAVCQEESQTDEAWAESEGLPSMDSPFIQKYLDGRDALIAQEKRQRSDHAFREIMSPMAAEADAIISQIRFEEQQTLWQSNVEDELAESTQGPIFPGMMFSLAKERMESSRLWQIVKKMPKGALLHCHIDAMGDPDWSINAAFTTPGICIVADGPLHTPALRQKALFTFAFAKAESFSADGLPPWSESYVPKSKIPIAVAAESFPDGGTEGFKTWLKSRITITEEESISHHMGPNDIWNKFISCFQVLKPLHRYEPIFRSMIRMILKNLNDDGVRWVDIRDNFLTGVPFYKTNSETPSEDFFDNLEALQEEIANFKNSEEGKNFWGARVIWTSIRHGGPKAIIEDMKNCISMKLEFPELIGGYDLVGQEDLGRPLVDLLPELFWFRKTCMQEGVDIPFFFHASETLGTGDEVDHNIFDAILLGTRRIGHGITLYKHPLLCDMVKEKKILIESCPVSNEVLRFTGSIMHNTLPALLARGIPCSLSNDDPAILGQGSSGMSHDFWQCLQGWEDLGLAGLASLAENSVRWANYEDCTSKDWTQSIKDGAYGKGIRAQRLREWQKEFEQFCAWVVMTYGEEAQGEGLD